jgi:hypothetical protein
MSKIEKSDQNSPSSVYCIDRPDNAQPSIVGNIYYQCYFVVSGTTLGPMTRFYLLSSSSWGALSDERTGLQFVVQSVSGQSRGGLITIHYCLA